MQSNLTRNAAHAWFDHEITKQVLPRAAWILRGIDLGKLVVAVAGGSGNSV